MQYKSGDIQELYWLDADDWIYKPISDTSTKVSGYSMKAQKGNMGIMTAWRIELAISGYDLPIIVGIFSQHHILDFTDNAANFAYAANLIDNSYAVIKALWRQKTKGTPRENDIPTIDENAKATMARRIVEDAKLQGLC